MNDNMNYTYKDAFYDMKEACEKAMKTSRDAINTAMELNKKCEAAMTLLRNCTEYVSESIGDAEEALEVFKGLGFTDEDIEKYGLNPAD